MKKKVATLFGTAVLFVGLSTQLFGAQISFRNHYVDSNTFGYVTRTTKDYNTNYVSVDLDRILRADGTYSNYRFIKGRFYVATTAEALTEEVLLSGRQSQSQPVSHRVLLKRTVPRGTSVSFFAKGNNDKYDCIINGLFTVN